MASLFVAWISFHCQSISRLSRVLARCSALTNSVNGIISFSTGMTAEQTRNLSLHLALIGGSSLIAKSVTRDKDSVTLPEIESITLRAAHPTPRSCHRSQPD